MKRTFGAGDLWEVLDSASRAVGWIALGETNETVRQNLEDTYMMLKFWLLQLEELDEIDLVWKRPG